MQVEYDFLTKHDFLYNFTTFCADSTFCAKPLGLIERPVYTEVNSTLAVLILGLGKRPEAARDERAHISVVVHRHAIEHVRHKGEGDVTSVL